MAMNEFDRMLLVSTLELGYLKLANEPYISYHAAQLAVDLINQDSELPEDGPMTFEETASMLASCLYLPSPPLEWMPVTSEVH